MRLPISIRKVSRCCDLTLASIEGRVAVDYFDPDMQGGKFVFKCHRVQSTVFPVNAIAFHPGYGTFATGGCDGYVSLWDGRNKKLLAQLPSFPTSVSSLSFNHDGSLLAVAASYTFEEGEKDHPPDQVYIHAVRDSEVKPKPRAAGTTAAAASTAFSQEEHQAERQRGYGSDRNHHDGPSVGLLLLLRVARAEVRISVRHFDPGVAGWIIERKRLAVLPHAKRELCDR